MKYITNKNLFVQAQLGSQMTQYAGLYAVSKKLNSDIKIFREFSNQHCSGKLFDVFNLDYELNPYNLHEPINSVYNIKNILLDSEIFTLDPNNNWDINGYFHTYNYFHQYQTDIIKLYQFKSDILDIANKNIEKIRGEDLEPIISLHVRRGDYLHSSSLNLTLDYYTEAISIFVKKIVKFKILVFSDDILWCKQNITGENVFYSENNTNYVDLCMMTLCNHNIIANSSFSWWGAYLNQNLNKIVVCSKKYVGEHAINHIFINENYYPKEWISI